MKKKLIICLMLALTLVITIGQISAEERGASYVDGSKYFLEIKNKNRQAEAWAMCSATYDAMAELLSEAQPARSQELKELANGAKIAVTMSLMSDCLNDPEITPERFNSLWKIAKLLGSELPKTRQTMLAAEAESAAGKKNAKIFIANLSATLAVCFKNLEGQQMYIDIWRELAKSGLLKLPDE